MKNKIEHDYTIFSKEELAAFLQKHEGNFLYCISPFDILIEKKMDAVRDKINQNLEKSGQIMNEYQQCQDNAKYLHDMMESHKEWKRLEKEYDRLSKLRFAKEVEDIFSGSN